MKLFKKPRWLKPEVNEPRYYVHIAIITGIALVLIPLINEFFDCCAGTFWDEFITFGIAIMTLMIGIYVLRRSYKKRIVPGS